MRQTGVLQPEVDPAARGSAPALDYAPTDPRRARRRRVRRLALVGVMCLLLAAGWRWGPDAFHRARVLYWQRQCLRYAGSADVAVYETDPRVVSTLVAGRHQSVPRSEQWAVAGLSPAAGYVAPCWEQLFPDVAWANAVTRGLGDATIFCHRRTSPGGHERLVCVALEDRPSRYGYGRELAFVVAVILPGDWRRPPTEVWSSRFIAREAYPPAVYHAFAGRASAQDPSRFSFRGQSDTSYDSGWVFECQLEDDDTVRIATSNVLWPPPAPP